MPKKGGKAALKKKLNKQSKQAKEPKNTTKQNADVDNGTMTAETNNPSTAATATQETNSSVFSSFADPDKKLKEFVRDIHIHNFTLAPIGGGLPLVQGSDVKLIHGHRYGLIGFNGAGKTTLLHHLASGNVKEIPPYLRILHVHQELEGSELTVLATVMKADKEREELVAKEAKLRKELEGDKHEDDKAVDENGNGENDENGQDSEKHMDLFFKKQAELESITDRLKFIESDTAEARASGVLDGLQFTDRMKNMKTSDLSGGWRMRVSLACALFVEPDVLLLDEPTNHLDFPSVIWLSEYLSLEYPKDKTMVIVSHDRRFLNDVCTDIIHLDSKKLIFYKGNYDAFIEVRRQSRIHQRKQYDRQQKMIKHNEDFIARFKANKKWSTQAQSRMKLLAKTNKIEKVLEDLEFRFYFPEPPKLKNPNIFHLDAVTFGYFGDDSSGKSYLLHNINLRLQMGTKVGLLGANGSGKSTLVRLIMNELDPLHGTCALSNSVEVGYFAQHHIETLDYNATPLEHLKNVFGDASVQQIYAQLGRFHLGNDLAKRKISTLSGGQKSRVAFSILTWYAPHLIIMDEPTNHLDLPTIDALGIALADFEGSVMLVSHDQHFVETVCDEYWAVGNRTVRVFDDFEECRSYCFKDCKPVDVLPREFSTIEIKKTKYKVNTKAGALNKAVADKLEEEKESGKVADLHIDPEREIDKGLEKGLPPESILRHIRGWKPIDGDFHVVNKLGFILFHDYFDKQYLEMHASEFFDRWKKLASYCVPSSHAKNQVQLVDITHACWRTAISDKNPRTKDAYSFGLILETMTRCGIITEEAVKEWRDKNTATAIPEAIQDIDRYVEAMQEDNAGDDSESD